MPIHHSGRVLTYTLTIFAIFSQIKALGTELICLFFSCSLIPPLSIVAVTSSVGEVVLREMFLCQASSFGPILSVALSFSPFCSFSSHSVCRHPLDTFLRVIIFSICPKWAQLSAWALWSFPAEQSLLSDIHASRVWSQLLSKKYSNMRQTSQSGTLA